MSFTKVNAIRADLNGKQWRKVARIMAYKDKARLTRETNIRFAKANFTELVHTASRFEGVNTTLPQTQTIIDGMGVSGVPLEDINVIVYLKRGWEYVLNSPSDVTLDTERDLNRIVAAQDSMVPGEFRTGRGSVSLGGGEEFIPNDVDPLAEDHFLTNLMASGATTTDKALTLMYHNMRGQLFWDGNKRTSTLLANKVMIDGGAGLINVPLDRLETWNELLSNFYRSNDMEQIKQWTYNHAISSPGLSQELQRQQLLARRQEGLER